jgi:hypothetical protein
MKGLIKKFNDYIKSINPEEKEPIDPRTLKLEDINRHFQLLCDTASNIRFSENDSFSIPTLQGHLGYPCIAVVYEFTGEEVDEFDSCAKYANRASNIFEKETEFTVYVEEGTINDYVYGLDNNPVEKVIGKTIIIKIFNKKIPNVRAR